MYLSYQSFYAIAAGFVIILIRVIINLAFKNNITGKLQILLRHLFYFYIICVLAITLLPIFEFIRPREYTVVSINIIPFKFIYDLIAGIRDISTFSLRIFLINVLGNIALFIPFGFLLPILNKYYNKFTKIIISSILFSLLIELAQLGETITKIVSFRACDIDDIIINCIGSIFGYLLYRCINFVINRYPNIFNIFGIKKLVGGN